MTKDDDQVLQKRVIRDFNNTESQFFSKKQSAAQARINKYSIDQSQKIDQGFELGLLPKQPSFAGTSIEILKRSRTALGSSRNLTFIERNGPGQIGVSQLTRAKSGLQPLNQEKTEKKYSISSAGPLKFQARGKIIRGGIPQKKYAPSI